MAPNEVFVGMQDAQYEPPAEMVEALAKELHAIRNNGLMENIARFVLRRQHERERGLLEALRSIERMNYIGPPARVCSLALDAHAKLDAPKVPEAPTLLEAAKAVVKNSAEPFAAFDALKAAVEREEKR